MEQPNHIPATMKLTANSNQKDLKSKKSTSLPAKTVEYLKNWMMSPEHIAHPYPTENEKAQIMADTGIELKQLTNWFVNNRKRYWKPRVEARIKNQTQTSNTIALTTMNQQQRSDDNRGEYCMISIYMVFLRTKTSLISLFFSPVRFNIATNVGHSHTIPNEFQRSILRTTQPSTLSSPQNMVNGTFHMDSQFRSSSGDYVSETIPILINNHYLRASFPAANGSYGQQTSHHVISTGSASSFSDCDSTTISNGSHEENHEFNISASNRSPNNRHFGPDQKTMIIGQSVANSPIRTYHDSVIQSMQNTALSHQTQSPVRGLKRVRSVSDFESNKHSSQVPSIARPHNLTANLVEDESSPSPKRRFSGGNKSVGWQNACRHATHGYDTALPTLEEATLLFGFASNN